MKHFYIKSIFGLCLFLSTYTQAQTYSMNTSGANCSANSGIDATYGFAFDNDLALEIGTFTDTNISGVELSSMDLIVYGTCSGDVEFFINQTPIYAGTTTINSVCTCESIESNPLLTQNYTIALTPDIISAYIIGGSNKLSVSATNSSNTFQTYYGADVVITTANLSNTEFEFQNKKIKLHPNPSNNIIQISGLTKQEKIKIYNVIGAEIIEAIVSNNEQIETKNLTNGIYFLKFEDGNTLKFIKK